MPRYGTLRFVRLAETRQPEVEGGRKARGYKINRSRQWVRANATNNTTQIFCQRESPTRRGPLSRYRRHVNYTLRYYASLLPRYSRPCYSALRGLTQFILRALSCMGCEQTVLHKLTSCTSERRVIRGLSQFLAALFETPCDSSAASSGGCPH